MPPSGHLATFGKPFGLELYRGGKAQQHSRSPCPSPDYVRPACCPVPADGHVVRLPPGRHDADPEAVPLLRPPAKDLATPGSTRRRRREWGCAGTSAMAPSIAIGSAAGARASVPCPADRQKPAYHRRAQAAARQGASQVRRLTALPDLRPAPSDPHHLRFAQPRAIGLKVSDEFTVPLCRGHHRQLHQAGNEVTWWENLRIKPLEIAKALWEETHPKAGSSRGSGFPIVPQRPTALAPHRTIRAPRQLRQTQNEANCR